MYELKTILPKYDIKLPTCMYTMKSVGFTSTSIGSGQEQMTNGPKTQDKSDDTTLIIQRQEKLLKQLDELKSQLAEIRSSLGIDKKSENIQKSTEIIQKNETKIENQQQQQQDLPEIVINSHPKLIPYSLLAFKYLWKTNFQFNVKFFTHSSLLDIGTDAKEFQQKLCSEIKGCEKIKSKIKITFIWMDCEDTKMIPSSKICVPIYGEMNIIRYLSRIGPNDYCYENSSLCNEIDIILDLCYQLLRSKTSKSKLDIICLLSNRLQQKQYFCGAKISIADIGVFSTFKRLSEFSSTKDLTPVLNNWFKRIETINLF